MTERDHQELSLVKQCGLLRTNRSGLCYEPLKESGENLLVMRLPDKQYLQTPLYGVKRLLALLVMAGYCINRKWLHRLLRSEGWQTLYPQARTTSIDPAAYKYPCLFRGLEVKSKNQVWAIDITYLPMKNGFTVFVCGNRSARSLCGWLGRLEHHDGGVAL